MEKSLEEIDRLLEKLQVEADGCTSPKRFGSPTSQVDCTAETRLPDHKKLKRLITKDQENNQVPKHDANLSSINPSKNKAEKDTFCASKVPNQVPHSSFHLPDTNNNANSARASKHKHMQQIEQRKEIISPELKLKSPASPKSLVRHEGEDDKKKISFPSLVRVLTKVNNVLITKHSEDLSYVWNSVKPDKVGGRHTVAVETAVREDFHIIYKNCLNHLKELRFDDRDSFEGWQSVKNILNVTWILSDSSVIFSQQLIWDDETLQLTYYVFKTFINHDQFEEDKTLKYCVKAFLGILHNICRHCFEAKEYLRKFPFLSVLMKLSKTRIAMIKAKCLIVMSYIVNDSEIHIVSTDSQVLVFIINILKDAKRSEDHMSYKYGMNVVEILHGINNLLANDDNKEKLLSLEILEEYLELLAWRFTDEEVYLTVLGLWKLSFHRSNKEKMRASQTLLAGTVFLFTFKYMKESIFKFCCHF